MSRRNIALLVVSVLALALAAVPALAAKGGNGNGNGGKGQGNATATSSISLDQAGQALALGDSVTFTTTIVGLQGPEWAMVYVECTSDADGSVVYGQLDYPDVSFVLGGGSSPWWLVRGPAACVAHLYAYGGKSGGYDTIRELASPVSFHAEG